MRTLRVVEVLNGNLDGKLEPYTVMNLEAASASKQHLGLHEGRIETTRGVGSFFVFAFFEEQREGQGEVQTVRRAALELEPEEQVALLGLGEVARLAQGDPRIEMSYVGPVPFDTIESRLLKLEDSES